MSITRKKFLTLALVLFVVGAVGFGWLFTEKSGETQTRPAGKEDPDTGFVKVDQLLKGQISIESFTTEMNLTEQDQRKEISDNDLIKETLRPFVFTGSVVCVSTGVAILACQFLLLLARCTASGLSFLRKYFIRIFEQRKKAGDKQLSKAEPEDDNPKEDILDDDKLFDAEEIEMLYCDEKSLALKDHTEAGDIGTTFNTSLFEQSGQKNHKKTLPNEVKQMTETVKEALSEYSEPVETTLAELTQQVLAIREYASYQHDKNEKLQEGYDWHIVRTFCLRIIRCIDHLEDRVSELSEQDSDTKELEEIMDELVFALESSGIEQFRPKINTDYCGQEKAAEVVRDKAHPDRPDMSGKIAEVIKPGYRYVIDDANARIVRTARIKLFE